MTRSLTRRSYKKKKDKIKEAAALAAIVAMGVGSYYAYNKYNDYKNNKQILKKIEDIKNKSKKLLHIPYKDLLEKYDDIIKELFQMKDYLKKIKDENGINTIDDIFIISYVIYTINNLYKNLKYNNEEKNITMKNALIIKTETEINIVINDYNNEQKTNTKIDTKKYITKLENIVKHLKIEMKEIDEEFPPKQSIILNRLNDKKIDIIIEFIKNTVYFINNKNPHITHIPLRSFGTKKKKSKKR